MKYTITVGGTDKVFSADNITEARKYAESKGWIAANVVSGDWVAYPSSGFPSAGTTPTPKEKIEASAAELRAKFVDTKAPAVTPTVGVGIGAGATPRERIEASAAELAGKFTDATRAERDDYRAYREFLKTEEGVNWPVPKDSDDFIANIDKWAGTMAGADDGDIGDEWTDDQIREYRAYLAWYSAYGELGAWKPVDIADFYANYEQTQSQITQWQQLAQEREAEQVAREEYALDPAEAARRREESYREGRYAAQERYRETPEYFDPFTQFMNQQSAMSGAFSGFVEREYPSLQSEYKAGLPRLTGFPTREAARAEAGRREAGWQAWLPQQVPGLYQEYMGQRPWERGVRYATVSPTTRAVNW